MGLFGNLFGEGKPPEALPGCEYELMWVPGRKAVARALELRGEWNGVATPIIIGPLENFERLTDVWGEADEATPQEELEAAARVDVTRWFALRSPESAEDAEFAASVEDPSAWAPGSGKDVFDFTVVRHALTGKLYPWVIILKAPTAAPYEAPAYMRYGGWNACPLPHEHVAIWKRWEEKYGARILCMSGDVIEATVDRPPETKEECYALAGEQFAYCEDIVTQGVETIDALASTLDGAKSWYFWWD